MKTVKIVCDTCGKINDKPKAEIARRKKKGKTKFYCNGSCAGKANYRHLKKYNKQNTEIILKYCDNRQDEFTPFRYHLSNAKRRAGEYKRDFDLDLEYLKNLWEQQEGKCFFTNIDMEPKYLRTLNGPKNKRPTQASLDRIDNSKGYIKGNVRFVCLFINYARNDFTSEQVIDFIQSLSK